MLELLYATKLDLTDRLAEMEDLRKTASLKLKDDWDWCDIIICESTALFIKNILIEIKKQMDIL